MRRHLSFANVSATLALFLSLGGVGYAAATINGADIQNGTITGKKLKAHTLTGKQVNVGKLGQVPSASNADRLGGQPASSYVTGSALVAGLTPPPLIGATFSSGWSNYNAIFSPVGFWKDQLGLVHIQGDAANGASPPVGAVIFTLPPGYAPAHVKEFVALCGAFAPAPGVVTVLTTGAVEIGSLNCAGADAASVFLEGITFRTDG
jgi:hypothetical protein